MRSRYCLNCGKPLDGKQVQWCSPACANAAWQREHSAERAAYMRNRRAGLKPETVEDRLRARVTELEAENEALKAALRKEGSPA